MSDFGDLVRAVARIHQLPDGPIAQPSQAGIVNQVVVVGSGPDRYVLRTPLDPLDLGRPSEEFAVEAWCAEQARRHGVPTPEITSIGMIDGVPYSVQDFVAGSSGETARGTDLWCTLGRYAQVIAAITLIDAPEALFTRFGRDLPAAWRQHLDYNLNSLDDADPLLELGVYQRHQQPELRATFEWLRAESFEFGLSHGDLALRNILVEVGRPPVLIDWGSATTGPVPHTDLLNLLRNRDENDNPRDDEITAFADGFGVDVDRLRPQLTAMRILAALDLVRWAQERRPDLLESTVVAAQDCLSRERRR